jgi:HAD superfamily hydrolase (TIGR01509 family)
MILAGSDLYRSKPRRRARAGLKSVFFLWFVAEGVVLLESKPDPEAFLLAAARLGVPPETCLVFEDTKLGIPAATDARMAWVRISQP